MKKLLLCTIIGINFLSFLPAQSLTQSSAKNMMDVNGEEYLVGDDGILRIYVNIWGHVKSQGTYLIFDGANMINALSLAGGPLDGANLKKVDLISTQNNSRTTYNLESLINNSPIELTKLKLNPYDTIIIKESAANKILVRSNLVGAILQLVNVLYTIENLD